MVAISCRGIEMWKNSPCGLRKATDSRTRIDENIQVGEEFPCPSYCPALLDASELSSLPRKLQPRGGLSVEATDGIRRGGLAAAFRASGQSNPKGHRRVQSQPGFPLR